MIRGGLIGESLREGATIEGIPLTVRRLSRLRNVEPDQPPLWTLIEFDAADAVADTLASTLVELLDDSLGWYCDFHTSDKRQTRRDEISSCDSTYITSIERGTDLARIDRDD